MRHSPFFHLTLPLALLLAKIPFLYASFSNSWDPSSFDDLRNLFVSLVTIAKINYSKLWNIFPTRIKLHSLKVSIESFAVANCVVHWSAQSWSFLFHAVLDRNTLQSKIHRQVTFNVGRYKFLVIKMFELMPKWSFIQFQVNRLLKYL